MRYHYKHMLIDIKNTESNLDDVGYIRGIMEQIARTANMNVLKSVEHRFTPQGLTMIVVISQSHISYHSYPEFRTAFIDIFSCGRIPEEEIISLLQSSFAVKMEDIGVTMVERNRDDG